MSPMCHVGRRLLLPIFISNVGRNQSASWIVTLTFLTKSVSNESTFFVQRAHSYRAFLRNHIRTNFTCSRDYRTVNLCSKLVLGTTGQSTCALNLFSSRQSSRFIPLDLLSSLQSSHFISILLLRHQEAHFIPLPLAL